MNQYFTEVDIPDHGWRINYADQIMLMGSCFAENIGQRLDVLKFKVDQNPFGILYNPQSVAKSLNRLIECKVYTLAELVEHEGIWNSFDHHSRFSAVNSEEALDKINSRLKQSHNHLKKAKYLFVTFGTAWIYELKRTGEIVSNCHKLAASEFKRIRLTPGEIVEEYKYLLSELWKFNPNLKIMFTISPIRHWKDGAVENQLSKSSLLLAVDRLINGFGKERCAYFPSYEIMMDELRDYRFYASDLLHLNETAVDHIWSKFSKLMFSDESKMLMKDVGKLNKALGHRPFNLGSESYQRFLFYNLEMIERLIKKYPFLNLKNEKIHFKSKLDENQRQARETFK